MANTYQTAFMLLDLPLVGVQIGPQWAADLNTALDLIDQHDHTSGKGVLVPTAGMNIDADLNFNSNDAFLLRSVRFLTNLSVLTGVADLGCVYNMNGDLYWNNASGTPVKITSGSGLNLASIGTIGGDYGQPGVTASVTYSNLIKTYSFLQASGQPAKLFTGDIVLQSTTVGTQAVTIKADPTVSAYTLTLPLALPASKKMVTMTSSGQFAGDYDVDNVTLTISANNLKVQDSGINTTQIANGSIINSKIGAYAVDGGKIASGSITNTHLTANCVTDANISGVDYHKLSYHYQAASTLINGLQTVTFTTHINDAPIRIWVSNGHCDSVEVYWPGFSPYYSFSGQAGPGTTLFSYRYATAGTYSVQINLIGAIRSGSFVIQVEEGY